jgi:hypothetical protein
MSLLFSPSPHSKNEMQFRRSVNPASLMRTIVIVAEAEASTAGAGPKLAATS